MAGRGRIASKPVPKGLRAFIFQEYLQIHTALPGAAVISGAWNLEDGSVFKNIPNDRLIEDPIFKSSQQSCFLQSADFIAYALLKSEVPPTPHIAQYRLNEVYEALEPICVKAASRKDPRGLGVVRT